MSTSADTQSTDGPLTQQSFPVDIGTTGAALELSAQHVHMLQQDLLLARDSRRISEAQIAQQGATEELTTESETLARLSSKLDSVDAAANAVLNTYEILEIILLQLPMKDILWVQGVSSTFRDIIGRSVNVQRALYYPLMDTSPMKRNAVSMNPVLTLWDVRAELDFPVVEPEAHYSLLYLDHCYLPRGPWRPRSVSCWEEDSCYSVCFHYDIDYDFCSQGKRLRLNNYWSDESSGRDILVCRHPCNVARVALWFPDCKPKHKWISIEGGYITMGAIQAALGELYYDTIGSSEWRDYVGNIATLRKTIVFETDTDRSQKA